MTIFFYFLNNEKIYDITELYDGSQKNQVEYEK